MRVIPPGARSSRALAKSFAVVLAAVAFACGGRQSADVGEAPSAECASYGVAKCDLRARCDPDVIRAWYGDLTTCREREAIVCQLRSRAVGTGWTGQTIADCAASYRSAVCLALDIEFSLEGCEPRGLLADGEPCWRDDQCSGGACDRTLPDGGVRPAGCGKCSTVPPGNKACGPNFGMCPRGLVCDDVPPGRPVDYQCVAPRSEGEACDLPTCGNGLYCDSGICKKRVGAGEPCKDSVISCAVDGALHCIGGVCAPAVFAVAGEPCSLTGPLCTGGAICPITLDALDASKHCIARARDGERCDQVNDIFCMYPASCIDGTCQVPAPLGCP